MTMFAPEVGKRRKNCLLVSLSPGLGIFFERTMFAPAGGKRRKNCLLVSGELTKPTVSRLSPILSPIFFI